VRGGSGPLGAGAALVPDDVYRGPAEAEVDFGEVVIWLAGELVTCLLFCLRMSFVGRAVRQAVLVRPGARRATPP